MFSSHSPFPTVCSSAAYRGSDSTSAERTKFPGRREKSREFLRFSCLRKSVSKTSAKPVSCERIPYADEQGIISGAQGIVSGFGARAGNLARNQFLRSEISNCGNMYPCLPSDTPHFPRVDRAEPTRSASPRTFATLTPGSGGWARGGFPKFGRPWRRGALAPAARYGVVSLFATGTWRPA